MDGVLINTEPLHYRCWKEILKEKNGIDLDYEVYLPCIGSTRGFFMDLINENYGPVFDDVDKMNVLMKEKKAQITEAEGFPGAESRESEMYQELIRQLYEEKKELESSVQIEKQELSDYYSMWVHQIKTPIAALGVLIQSGEELEEVQESPKAQELTRSMKMEVFRIEQYVDMVLTYLRWVPQPPITPSRSAAWKKSSARQSANIPRCSS